LLYEPDDVLRDVNMLFKYSQGSGWQLVQAMGICNLYLVCEVLWFNDVDWDHLKDSARIVKQSSPAQTGRYKVGGRAVIPKYQTLWVYKGGSVFIVDLLLRGVF